MIECVADVRAQLGEGPVWDAREDAVYWVDIIGGTLFRWDERTGCTRFAPSARLCSIAPRASGGFVGGSHDGLVALDADFAHSAIVHPEPYLPGNRFNDGKVDRAGRFWAGTMDAAETQTSGALYRLDPDLRCQRIDEGYHVSNGPAFSPEGRVMYHTDSARQTVFAFDLDAQGNASGKRVFARFGAGQGYPDGMTVDAQGCLWIAFWDGWCIRRLSPDGAILAELAVPVQRPTSVAFGGADLDELFITSAARDLGPADLARQPQAGGLFRARPGVRGIAEMPFAG